MHNHSAKIFFLKFFKFWWSSNELTWGLLRGSQLYPT